MLPPFGANMRRALTTTELRRTKIVRDQFLARPQIRSMSRPPPPFCFTGFLCALRKLHQRDHSALPLLIAQLRLRGKDMLLCTDTL